MIAILFKFCSRGPLFNDKFDYNFNGFVCQITRYFGNSGMRTNKCLFIQIYAQKVTYSYSNYMYLLFKIFDSKPTSTVNHVVS